LRASHVKHRHHEAEEEEEEEEGEVACGFNYFLKV